VTTTRRLTSPVPSDSPLIADLVRVWRDARAARLRFLCDLHEAEEDREYLGGAVLPANDVWIAEVDGTLAGFIAFGDGWVTHLYVAPPFQGRGVGSDLLSIAMARHPALQLWVFEVNEPAVRFYQRRGFCVVERTDGASNEARRPDLRMQWPAPG
jgi:putative acetyltransferase